MVCNKNAKQKYGEIGNLLNNHSIYCFFLEMDWPGDNHDYQNKLQIIRSNINHWSNLLSLSSLWEEEPSKSPHPQKEFNTGQISHLPMCLICIWWKKKRDSLNKMWISTCGTKIIWITSLKYSRGISI